METNSFTLGNTEFVFFYSENGYKLATTCFTVPHFHPFPELFLVFSGETKMFGDTADYLVTPKDVCIMPPFFTHGTSADKIYERLALPFILRKTEAKKEEPDTYSVFAKVFFGDRPFIFPFLSALSDEIRSCFDTRNLLRNEKMRNLLSLILINAYNYADPSLPGKANFPQYTKPKSYYKTIVEIDALLDEMILGQLTFPQLAKKACLTTRQVSRLICAEYKTNSKEMAHTRKMKVALYFLRNTSLTVSQIAEAAGYTSRESFSYTFKKDYGISPENARKLYRQEQDSQ